MLVSKLGLKNEKVFTLDSGKLLDSKSIPRAACWAFAIFGWRNHYG
jgi:hypothetical protein